MTSSYAGLALASLVAVAALWNARRSGGYYAAGVYGMTAATHRRYALAGAAFIIFFAGTLVWRNATAALAGLAVYVVIAILYGTSFLRGAADDE